MRWIGVDERLPEDGEIVLVFCKYDRLPVISIIIDGFYYEHHEYCSVQGDAWVDSTICAVGSSEYDAVTHWMPLPEPPK